MAGELAEPGPPDAGGIAEFRALLARVRVQVPDRERIDVITQLEALKSAAAAVQARLAAAMAEEHVSQVVGREAQAVAFRSVAGQVGLARRISPTRAHSLVGLARLLCSDLPRTLAALSEGEISEWQATLVGRETVTLSPADRRAVDARLAPRLGPLGDGGVAREARRLADQVDAGALARRVKSAEADRRVTVRPAPGPMGCAMARLTATMPVAQAVACYAGLRRHAESARNAGDRRGLGQVMSDELFARVTGAASREAGGGTETGDPGDRDRADGAGHDARLEGAAQQGRPDGVGQDVRLPGLSIEVGLVMSEAALLHGGTDPAVLTDDQGRAFAHVPAVLARRLVAEADQVWLSRLFAAPKSGELVAMDARRRTFTGRLRKLLVWRDQTCRTPFCEAPIRHADHVQAYAEAGATELGNGAGLCEACNYLKEATGWRTTVTGGDDDGHVIEITTPTGHSYRSQAPPAPGTWTGAA